MAGRNEMIVDRRIESCRRALDLVSNEAERRHLGRRLREVAPA